MRAAAGWCCLGWLVGAVKSPLGLVGAEAVQDHLVSCWPSERRGFESHGPSRNTRRRSYKRYHYQEPDLSLGGGAWNKFRTQLAFVAYRQLQRFAR